MVLIENVMKWPLVPKKKSENSFASVTQFWEGKNVRGNSSMEIKHIPGVTYLNMQGKYPPPPSTFLHCFLALQVEQHAVRGGLFYFHLFAFKNKIRLGAVEHYSQDLQKHRQQYMITVRRCWTKPFYNSPLNSAQVQILRSLGSPACGWLRIPKLAGYDCLDQFFTSLMHMNSSQAPSSMLMSTLVCSGHSHCLLIKLILVEDAGNLTPKGQRGEGDFRVCGFFKSKGEIPPLPSRCFCLTRPGD